MATELVHIPRYLKTLRVHGPNVLFQRLILLAVRIRFEALRPVTATWFRSQLSEPLLLRDY